MKTTFFTVADQNNLPYAEMLEKTLRKFHDTEFQIFTEKKLKQFNIPSPTIYYLATPVIAKHLFENGYECVIKIDADSLVLGSLDHILNDDMYDVGTVLNWNRVDPQRFGLVKLATIEPIEYYNNGFVVMRNRQFVNEWFAQCFGIHFNRMPMREQGFLNILTHYGRFRVKCFDRSNMWHGLISKGEGLKMIIRDNQIVLPKGIDNYPNKDKTIKIIHWGGGSNEPKMNYRIYYSEPVIKYIDNLLK